MLVECFECNHMISNKAPRCENCGISIKSSKSRCLMVIFILVGGGLGLHRLYAGLFFSGLLQIGLTFITIVSSEPVLIIGLACWLIFDFLIIVFGLFKDSNSKAIA